MPAMNTQSQTISTVIDPSAWQRGMYAFLAETERRSGSRRTVESYSRMLQHFFGVIGTTPDRVTSPEGLSWAAEARRRAAGQPRYEAWGERLRRFLGCVPQPGIFNSSCWTRMLIRLTRVRLVTGGLPSPEAVWRTPRRVV